jgi:hypothetical protein
MKKLLLLLLLIMAVAFMSCEKDDLNETPVLEARIIGEWETFKVEKQELILDFNTDGSLNQSMQWYDQTSQFSTESTLEFNEDYFFNDFYAGVLVGEGIWNEINEDMLSFTFNNPLNNWSDLANTYTVNFYCDNTISIQYLIPPPAGNHEFQDSDWYVIQYYRTPGTSECDDLIQYQVD